MGGGSVFGFLLDKLLPIVTTWLISLNIYEIWKTQFECKIHFSRFANTGSLHHFPIYLAMKKQQSVHRNITEWKISTIKSNFKCLWKKRFSFRKNKITNYHEILLTFCVPPSPLLSNSWIHFWQTS